MFRENKVTLGKRSLHLLLHLVFQLRLLRCFATFYAFASIRCRLVHLVLCLGSICILLILMNNLFSLVETFLLEFLKTAQVVILNILLFVLSEYDICQVRPIDVNWIISILSRLEPWVIQCLFGCQPLSIIDLNEAANEILGFIGKLFSLEVKSTFENQFMQFLHGVAPERDRTEKHDVQANAGAPHVSLETTIAFLTNDLRSHVCRRAALFIHLFLLGLQLLRHAKIANLYLARLINKNVVKLDVAVHDELALMNVVEAGDHLLEQVLGIVFLELTTLSNVAEQIASLAQFHHEAHMFTRFK